MIILNLLQRYLLEMYFPVAHSPSLLHFPKKLTGVKLYGSSLLGNALPLYSASLRYERSTLVLGCSVGRSGKPKGVESSHAAELEDVGISKD